MLHARSPLLTAVLAGLWLLPAAAGSAEKLSKDDKKFLETVAPLMLPAEREIYEKLDKDGRKLFRDIFWGRRDTDPETAKADNDFRREYLQQLEEVDKKYRVLGHRGSETECGVVHLLLGPPAEVQQAQRGVDPGTRAPQSWVYRGEQFTGGEIKIAFDENCDLPRPGGDEFRKQLVKVAESKVRRPALGYSTGPGGGIVPLADQLPKPNPASALLAAPRQDFPLEAKTQLMMRGQDGTTYVAGLMRGEAEGLSVRDEGGRRVVDLVMAAEATALDGSVPQAITFEAEAEVDGEGRFLASWPLNLRGGNYTVRLAAADPESGKGSVTNLIFDVPDLAAGEMKLSPPLVFADMQQGVQPDPKGGLSAFTLGTNLIVPRYGNVFQPEDELQVIVFIYGAPTDASGAADMSAIFTISKDGKPRSRSPEQDFNTKDALAAVGPVPLARFEPGEYEIEVEVKDKVGGTTHKESARITVLGGTEAGEGESEGAAPQP